MSNERASNEAANALTIPPGLGLDTFLPSSHDDAIDRDASIATLAPTVARAHATANAHGRANASSAMTPLTSTSNARGGDVHVVAHGENVQNPAQRAFPAIATYGRVHGERRIGFDLGPPPGVASLTGFATGERPSLLKDIRWTHGAQALGQGAKTSRDDDLETAWNGSSAGERAAPKKRKMEQWGRALERGGRTPTTEYAREETTDGFDLNDSRDVSRRMETSEGEFRREGVGGGVVATATATPSAATPSAGEREGAFVARETSASDFDERVKKAKASEQRLKVTKEALLGQMERVDGEVASLERELAALKNGAEEEKFDAANDRKSAIARHKKDTEALRQRLLNAEKASVRASEVAMEKIREASALARGAAVKKTQKGSFDARRAHQEAAKVAAMSVKTMIDRQGVRVEDVERVLNANKALEAEAMDRFKKEIRLPALEDVERVDFDAVVKRVLDEANTPYMLDVKRRVTQVLQKRRDDVRRREYENALKYLKQREIWRVKMVQRANEQLAKTGSGDNSAKKQRDVAPALGRRGAGSDLSAGVARSEYEEMQIIKALQRKEELRHMIRIPDMIIDAEERRCAVFDSRNGLVEDPIAAMKLENELRPWTKEEKKIFHEKFNAYGKNFRRIAQHLDRRDTGDCVVYYYKYQKTDDGFRGRRRAAMKKRRAYADAKRALAFNPAAVEAQREERPAPTAEARLERAALAAANKAAKAKARAEKAKVRAKAEAEASEKAPTPKPIARGPEWTDMEKTKFISGLLQFGKDFDAISSTIRTRSLDAVKQFYVDNRESLDLDSFAANAS